MQSFLFKVVLLHGMMSNGFAVTTPGVKTTGSCVSPQFLYMGKEGSIECSITENFYGVYWFNSTDSTNSYPFLTFQDETKTGEGYNSGQYNVFPNGSLIIRNVSLQDDHQFRVIILTTKEDANIIYDISVYVVVQSTQPHPFIGVCGEKPFCFRQLPDHHEISCIVNGTRPAVNLAWMTHKASGIRNVTTEVTVSQNDHLYTTEAKTRTTYEGSIAAVLLLCQVTSTLDVIAVRESMALIENIDMKYPSLEKKNKIINNSTKVTLTCSGDTKNFIIWKERTNDTWLTIGYASFGSDHNSEVFYENYELKKDGSLVASIKDSSTEISFICICNDAKEDHIQAFDVVVLYAIDATSPVLMIVIILVVVVMVIVVLSALTVVVFNWRRRAVKKEVLDDTPASSKLTELDLPEQTITEDLKKEEQNDIKDNTETSPMLSSSATKVKTSVAVKQHKDPQKEANSSQEVPHQNTNVKKEVLDDKNPVSSKLTELKLPEQAITEDLKKEEQNDIKDNTETSPMLSSSATKVETSDAVEQHKDPQKEANSSQEVPYQNTNVHRNLGDTRQLQSSKSREKTQTWRKHDTEFDTDESSSEDEEEKNKRLGIFQNDEVKESAELAKLMEDKWTSPQ